RAGELALRHVEAGLLAQLAAGRLPRRFAVVHAAAGGEAPPAIPGRRAAASEQQHAVLGVDEQYPGGVARHQLHSGPAGWRGRLRRREHARRLRAGVGYAELGTALTGSGTDSHPALPTGPNRANALPTTASVGIVAPAGSRVRRKSSRESP